MRIILLIKKEVVCNLVMEPFVCVVGPKRYSVQCEPYSPVVATSVSAAVETYLFADIHVSCIVNNFYCGLFLGSVGGGWMEFI